MVVVSEVRKRYLLPAISGRVLGMGGGLWVLGLPDGVKDRIHKYGLVFIYVIVCCTFCMDMESFECVQMGSFTMVMEYLHDIVHRFEGMSFLM